MSAGGADEPSGHLPDPSPHRFLTILLTISFVLLSFVMTCFQLGNNDIWFHLETGEWIVENRAIPKTDPFSYTAGETPYIAHEWLADLAFHLIHAMAGPPGLVLLKVAVAGATFWILVLAVRARKGMGPLTWTWPLLSIVILQTFPHWFVRPHIFANLFIAASLWVIEKSKESQGRLWWLLPLQILWANVHGSFLLGVIIPALFMAGEVFERLVARWTLKALPGSDFDPEAGRRRLLLGIVSLSCFMACLVNPYGISLLSHPFELSADARLMAGVLEWRTPFSAPFNRSLSFKIYIAWIVIGIMALSIHKVRFRRFPVGTAFVWWVLLLLSVRASRFTYTFCLATFPMMASALEEAFMRRKGTPEPSSRFRVLAPGGSRRYLLLLTLIGNMMILPVPLTVGYPLGTGFASRFGAGEARNRLTGVMDFLVENRIEGRVFNGYNDGSYVLYRGYPLLRNTIDSRGYVFPADVRQRIVEAHADPDALRQFLEDYDVNVAIFPKDLRSFGPALRGLSNSPSWMLADFDDHYLCFLRRDPEHDGIASRTDWRLINPARYFPGQTRVPNPRSFADEAERYARAHPDTAASYILRGDAALWLGKREEAMTIYREGSGRFPNQPYLRERAGSGRGL